MRRQMSFELVVGVKLLVTRLANDSLALVSLRVCLERLFGSKALRTCDTSKLFGGDLRRHEFVLGGYAWFSCVVTRGYQTKFLIVHFEQGLSV